MKHNHSPHLERNCLKNGLLILAKLAIGLLSDKTLKNLNKKEVRETWNIFGSHEIMITQY